MSFGFDETKQPLWNIRTCQNGCAKPVLDARTSITIKGMRVHGHVMPEPAEENRSLWSGIVGA